MRNAHHRPPHEVTRGMIWLARSGYAARGLVYVIVACFAVLAAFGEGQTVGTEGALQSLLSRPFGETLLWLIVVGLLAFAAWRMLQALFDTDNHGRDAKGLLIRSGLIGSAVVHTLLALFTLGLLGSELGTSGSSGSGGSGGDFLSGLLGWRYSSWLIYLIALVPLGVGIAHLIKGWKARFERYFQASEHVLRWVRPISRFGLMARGVAFLVIAGMLFTGGNRYEPTDPPGLQDALNALHSMPFGTWLLLIVGLGLLGFALYSLAEAIWRRINMASVTH